MQPPNDPAAAPPTDPAAVPPTAPPAAPPTCPPTVADPSSYPPTAAPTAAPTSVPAVPPASAPTSDSPSLAPLSMAEVEGLEPGKSGTPDGALTPNSRWAKAYSSAYSRLPSAVSSRLPTAEEAQASAATMSARLSKYADDSSHSIKGRRAKLRADFFAHGYSVANATQIPLYISLNQVGPLMYEAVSPNGVFERRAPPLYFFLEVRAAGGPYTPWSVTWPILAVAGPAVALSSLAAIPLAPAVTGSATLAGLSTAVYSSIASAGATAVAAGTKVASAAARLSLLPGGKKLHGKLVDAAKAHVEQFKKMGKEHVLRYATTAMAAVTGGKSAADKVTGAGETEAEQAAAAAAQEKMFEKIAEVDITGYPLVKVLACKTGKRKLDAALEAAFKKLDFKTRDFQPKTNPVLRVVGGPELEERAGKQFLIFYPLRLEHIIDLEAEPLPTDEVPPTADEQGLADDAKVVDTWEEASVTSEDAPPHADREDPKTRSWLDAWRKK